MTDKIVPCLWFDGDAEAATAFYVSLLPDSRVTAVNRSPVDTQVPIDDRRGPGAGTEPLAGAFDVGLPNRVG